MIHFLVNSSVRFHQNSNILLQVFTSCLALGLATPDAAPEASPDADAFYGQYQWPGYGGYGFSSTCYGCRPYVYGKRSAEPHGTGVAVHPGLATSFRGPTVFGYPRYGKRSAEAHGVAYHPYGVSHVGRTVFGYPYYGKRSAEPHGTGVAVHPGHAVSHVGPTVYGFPHYGKRSAEPQGLGVHPGHATSYVGRTIYGYPHLYGKREAEADADADAYYGYYPYAYGGYGYGWPGGYTSVSGIWG